MPRLILMSDDERLPDPVAAVKKLSAGDGVILRHRDSSERRRLARILRPLCLRLNVFLIIAGDARLALAVNADGIHLAEAQIGCSALPVCWARQRGMIVTAAVHGEAALRRAAGAGLDGVLVSPVFTTASHPGKRSLGILRLARMAGSTPLATYGLGGIDHDNLMRLKHTGLAGVAGIGVIANSG